MRLFEVDQGSAREVLAVFQGLINQSDLPSEIPFPAVMHMIKPFGLGISSVDGLIALKDKVDPAGDVISDILDNGTVVLRTTRQTNQQDRPLDNQGGSMVDKMASRAAKDATK